MSDFSPFYETVDEVMIAVMIGLFPIRCHSVSYSTKIFGGTFGGTMKGEFE